MIEEENSRALDALESFEDREFLKQLTAMLAYRDH